MSAHTTKYTPDTNLVSIEFKTFLTLTHSQTSKFTYHLQVFFHVQPSCPFTHRSSICNINNNHPVCDATSHADNTYLWQSSILSIHQQWANLYYYTSFVLRTGIYKPLQ